MEILDAHHAAGTPALNMGRLTPEPLISPVPEVSMVDGLVGVVVTDVAPSLDARGITELVATDRTHSSRRGAREGPRALRKATTEIARTVVDAMGGKVISSGDVLRLGAQEVARQAINHAARNLEQVPIR